MSQHGRWTAQAEEELEKVKTGDVATSVKNETTILKARIGVVKILTDVGHETELKAQIAQWKEEESSGSAAGAASAAPRAKVAGEGGGQGSEMGSDAVTSMLGKRPPCSSFADLITMSEMDDIVDTFYQCGDQNQITEINDQLKIHSKAANDLLLNLRQATADVGKAVKDFEKALASRQKAKSGTVEAKQLIPEVQHLRRHALAGTHCMCDRCPCVHLRWPELGLRVSFVTYSS